MKITIRLKGEGGTGTPGSGNSARSTPKKTQLVSYNDPDAGLSDEDREPGERHESRWISLVITFIEKKSW